MTHAKRLTPASVLSAALLAASGCSDLTAPTEQPDAAIASTVDATPLAVTVFDNALALERSGEREVALLIFNRALELTRTAGQSQLERRTLFRIGYNLEKLDRFDEAADVYENLLPLVTAAGETARLESIENNVGLIYRAIGNADKSYEHLRRAYQYSKEGLGTSCAEDLYPPFNFLIESCIRGDFGLAIALLEETETRFEKPRNDQRGHLAYLDGAVKLALDEFAAAEAAFARAATFHRDSPTSSRDNELRNRAYAVLHRAEIAKAWHGDWARAADLVDEADATFAMMPFSRGRWSAALERFEIAIAAETFDLASDHLTTAWKVGVELAAERPITRGEYLYARTRLATELEQYGDAIDLAREALVIFRSAGSVTYQARLFTLLARIEASRGESTAAIALLDHALELYAALDARDDLVRARFELARVLARAGYNALAEELMRAAAEIGAVYAYRTDLEYQLANAVVLAYAGDLDGAATWLTVARQLAEGQPAGDPLGLRLVSEAQTEVAALTISTEPPRVSARATDPAVIPALVAPSLAVLSALQDPTVAATLVVPTETFRLSPQVASVTVADDATARYRWTVTNISERALSLQVWLNDSSPRLRLDAIDRNVRARVRGDQPTEIALAPGEKRAVFVELPPEAVSTSIALLHARDLIGGHQASAAFEVHRDDAESITDIADAASSDAGVSIGSGVAWDPRWDPALHGVEFFHELRSLDLPEIERVTLTVTASARCYLEIRDGSGHLIAIDADGDGRLDGRGDSVYGDLDGDGRADLAIVRDAETTPFVVVAYPTDGDVELTVSVTAKGTIIASGRDVILRR